MIDSTNWRFNPFTEITNEIALVGELHEVQFDIFTNAFGIRLNEGIHLIGATPFNDELEYKIIVDVNTVTSGTIRIDITATR